MFWVLTDHPDHTLAADDFAIITQLFDRRTDLHTSTLFISIRDATLGQIVRRHFNRNSVSDQNLDIVHSHFARNVGQNLNSVIQLHPKRRIRQRFRDHPVNLDRSLFCHAFID